MNPIEVAIDEMSRKVSELNQLCSMEEVDMIRLQLKLQGSVSVKVGSLPKKSDLWATLGSLLCFVTHYLLLSGERRAHGLCEGVFRGEEC